MKPEDLEFLRGIRGRFQGSKSQQQGEWFLIFFALAFFPALFLVLFFAVRPIGVDQIHFFCMAMGLVSFITGIQIFRRRGVEYEFTGEEIVEKRGGKIKSQIRISEIIETEVPIGMSRMILKTNNSKMAVQIVPSLNEVIQKKATETMTAKSEAEQKCFAEIKRETLTRFKRVNLIFGIIFLLVIVALSLLIAWFSRKH